MKEEEWYKVENLRKLQKQRNEEYSKGKKDNRSDFDSYRMLNEGNNDSNISSHNAIGDSAKNLAKVIKNIITKKTTLNTKTLKLADVGGGVGFIANAIAEEFESDNIYSYDIAEEATKYGNIHFKNVHFINRGLEISDILEEGAFDVILANEFYPFTRNNDWEYQKSYISMCINNLKKQGVILIGLPDKEECLLENYEEIKNEFKELQPYKYLVPYTKVMKVCGGNVPLAQIISTILKGGKKLYYFIVLQSS